jgi:hypothetical protein
LALNTCRGNFNESSYAKLSETKNKSSGRPSISFGAASFILNFGQPSSSISLIVCHAVRGRHAFIVSLPPSVFSSLLLSFPFVFYRSPPSIVRSAAQQTTSDLPISLKVVVSNIDILHIYFPTYDYFNIPIKAYKIRVYRKVIVR